MGHTCFVCDKKKEKKIPGILAIGKYRQLRFCKKSELSEPHICKTVEAVIDKQMDLICARDILPVGFDADGSKSETDDEAHLNLCTCDRYRDINARPCITDPFKPLLTFTTQDGVVLNFCKASHLTRYLIRHYTSLSKGKATTPTKKKKAPTNNTHDDDDEDDAPPNTTHSSTPSFSPTPRSQCSRRATTHYDT